MQGTGTGVEVARARARERAAANAGAARKIAQDMIRRNTLIPFFLANGVLQTDAITINRAIGRALGAMPQNLAVETFADVLEAINGGLNAIDEDGYVVQPVDLVNMIIGRGRNENDHGNGEPNDHRDEDDDELERQ